MQACGERERKQQTSSAMTCGERGGICGLKCARKWAAVRRRANTQMPLGARLRQTKHCAGLQRAKLGSIGVAAERAGLRRC